MSLDVIIPASGVGQRFIDAGYTETKPLIPVIGKKLIIDYVFDMFSKEDIFHVIVSESTEIDMFRYVELKREEGYNIIFYVYLGKPLGPVGCILGTNVLDNITGEVVISYCDFGMEWNYSKFKSFLEDKRPDACIPVYSGFHPHLIDESNVYAVPKTVTVNSEKLVFEVNEKYKPVDRFSELHSPGVYYFKDPVKMKDSFEIMLENKDFLNDELYVSLAYNHYLSEFPEDRVLVYEDVYKFYQFGTPKDFEYAKQMLTNAEEFEQYVDPSKKTEFDNLVILSAGRGERFTKLNYPVPKPFLPIDNKPLIQIISEEYSSRYYIEKTIFVGAEDHSRYWLTANLEGDLKLIPPNKIGAAYSYSSACSELTGSTLILPCDLLQNENGLESALEQDPDFIVFVSKGTTLQQETPSQFAWVQVNGSNVTDISVKERSPGFDLILNGSFYAKDNSVLINLINTIQEQKLMTNGEYYLDNAFKLAVQEGYKVLAVDVGFYYSFGTHEEYQESKYFLTKCSNKEG